jgi:hypothetical protein
MLPRFCDGAGIGKKRLKRLLRIARHMVQQPVGCQGKYKVRR